MELHSYSIDVFSLFKEKIQDAIGLVTQIPVEQKDEAWKFWELMSETVKLFTRIYIDGQQTVNIEVCVNTEDDSNKQENSKQNEKQTKRKRGRPKHSDAEKQDSCDGESPKKVKRKQSKKSPAKTQRKSNTGDKKSEETSKKLKEDDPETVTKKVQGDDLNNVGSPPGSSDHGTVDDVVSSFNLDFSDLMSIPSSVEAPQSQMSNTNLQSPLHIDNVMTPVSNKEDLVKDNESSVNTCIYKDTSNKVELVKSLTDKENIVPVTVADDAIQPVIQFDILEESVATSPKTTVRRSYRKKKKNSKDKDIYKFENKMNSEGQTDDYQTDGDMDVYDDQDTDGLSRSKSRRKKRKRVKPQRDDSDNTDITCDVCDTKLSSFAALEADLARHKMKHSGEKPFLCELCPKSFTRLQYLNEHMNLHLGNRPHKCKKCPATFYDLSAYHRHIHKHRVEEKEKDKSKSNEEEQPTPSRLIMTRNAISQTTLEQIGAVLNQETERFQQHNDEHSYQTIIVSTDESHHESGDNSIQPSTSFVTKGDEEGQPEVYHISLDPNILSNDPANLIATVDFSAINLLANATTKQFTLS
ncbi:hypothetical protein KUTeg_020162 [Tegillarca granosa]|uniref:C2H2-type domain-containing protein n=1 Tax=Tegillarca granosa TaxID=220873 RepID=A0ABQ9E7N9_TEGGR|nr:hypothetical protein KUTeg_020162 [Tegillarca granosa]